MSAHVLLAENLLAVQTRGEFIPAIAEMEHRPSANRNRTLHKRHCSSHPQKHHSQPTP
jgi:hypothetical protein